MRASNGRLLRFAVGCLLAALCSAAPAVAAPTRTTYQVPVTQPDEFGAPVSLETDVYLPDTPPPAGGHPTLLIFHGGGSDKDNEYDSGHAAYFADHGYAVVLYSARGHGGSGGQVTVAGPKEMRDLFDVTAWALGIGGRDEPVHPDFQLDASRIALAGYSQGGLHTNLGQAHRSEEDINPYGDAIHFRALEPGNTPDHTFNALVENQAVKLSFGVGLLGTYYGGTGARVAPIVDKWLAAALADQPQLYGGALCDVSEHDTATSTMKQDLAYRSPGCYVEHMTPPSLWAQALDDELFTPDMAVSMWRRMPAGAANRLYLDMAGHGAPRAHRSVEDDKLAAQLAFLDHQLRGQPLAAPPLVYWTRDPAVTVAGDAAAYPAGAWYRQTAASWPPAGAVTVTYVLSEDGRLVRDDARPGSRPLAPINPDPRNDPITRAALSSTPLGTSPSPAAPGDGGSPGLVAAFATKPFPTDQELSGSPAASLAWTPASPDSQVVVKVFDAAPDGTLTLLSRGVQGIRGATLGVRQTVVIDGHDFSARIRKRHRVVAWVTAGDSTFYKPYPGSAGGTLHTGPGSTLALPLRRP